MKDNKQRNKTQRTKHKEMTTQADKQTINNQASKGPWLGGMFLEKKAEALNLFLQTTLLDPAYLKDHMEGFAFDLDMDMATECIIADVQGQLANMLDMKSFLRKNMNVELKRWFSFTYSFPTLDKEWTAVHAVLTWMQFQMAEWRPETLKDLVPWLIWPKIPT